MKKSITTDKLIAYINCQDDEVIFNQPISCPLCRICMMGNKGVCLSGGPFDANGHAVYEELLIASLGS